MTAIRAIHASARALGLDEDTRRDVYSQATGKRSLTEMSPGEQGKVLDVLRARGAKPAPKGRKLLTGPYAKKLQALWIAGWNLGIVRNRDDKAMLAFIERQTKIQNTAFLRDPADARKAVEALKSWLTREGHVVWTDPKIAPDFMRASGFKIAWAQFKRLNPDLAVRPGAPATFTAEVALLAGALHISVIDDAGWRVVMNAFGECIRKIRSEAAPERKAG